MISMGQMAVAHQPFYLVVIKSIPISAPLVSPEVVVVELDERELADPASDVIQVFGDDAANRIYQWREKWWGEIDMLTLAQLAEVPRATAALLRDYSRRSDATPVYRAIYRHDRPGY